MPKPRNPLMDDDTGDSQDPYAEDFDGQGEEDLDEPEYFDDPEDEDDQDGDDQDDGSEDDPEGDDTGEREELTIMIDDGEKKESPSQRIKAGQLKRHVRRIKELEAKLESLQPKAETLRPRPKFEDYDLDDEKYEPALTQWLEEKAEFDAREKQARKQEEQEKTEWEEKRNNYFKSKTSFKVQAKDYDEAESEVIQSFNTAQQSILIDVADNPTHLTYALGKNEKYLEQLASIKNPVKFAAAIARLEGRIRVTKRSPTTQPEKRHSSTGGGNISQSTHDRKLEKLREAGKFDEAIAYKRKHKLK